MEILTLLKANIRHRKGSFTSIILLMLIISMAMTAMISIRDNCSRGIENAFEQVNAADLTVCIRSQSLSAELLNDVADHPLVENVTAEHTICSDNIQIGEYSSTSSWFLRKLQEDYRIFTPDLSGYEDSTPALSSGEIYITQGIMTGMNCRIGDTVKLSTIGGNYEFQIKGIIAEPVFGASTIGLKQVFISDEDFEKMYAEGKAAETEKLTADIVLLSIYKSADCGLSDAQFKRRINLDTGVIDKAFFSMTKDLSEHYTNLFSEIILSILMVFVGLLFVIVLIVMGHSISSAIEMDYVNLGILKAQGFTQTAIRTLFALQYLLAEVIGAAVGILFSIPLARSVGSVFQPITAILAERNISLSKGLLSILLFLLLSGLFLFAITRRIGKISPIRAICGGQSEIYFDSRIKAPISPKALSASLAFRQFTSAKRRYIGTIAIVTILVYFMMTIMILGNTLNSKSAIESMGGIYTECSITFKQYPDDQTLEEIEKTIEEYSPVEKKYYMTNAYFSLDGEELFCLIYKNPDVILALEGRAPLYDNEIIITQLLAEELDLKMGDTVTVSNGDLHSEYIISGIFQSLNDTGMCFAMNLEGAQKLTSGDILFYAEYSLFDPSKKEEAAEALNDKFPELLQAKATDANFVDDIYTLAINAMKLVIYLFSIIFALIVVMMVCSKMFLREKTDIGIFKAIGFTSLHLRFQFAVRFLIVAVAGSAFGVLLSILFSGRMLSSLLRNIGVTSFTVCYTPLTFTAPILLICFCFFLFAFLISGKIKKVEIRELVTE